jgi:CheY-like chemotaxis protein
MCIPHIWRTAMPHILVIEDDPSTQTLFSAVLRHHGVECTVVGDGERALAELRRTRYDAIILDLLLPKVNGFEVLRELKCTSPATLSSVIVCSAVSEATLRDCEELRMVRKFLLKPIDINGLADEVIRTARVAAAPAVIALPAPSGTMVNLMTIPLPRDAS